MGVRIIVGGNRYEAEAYSVSEDSTPTSSDDSSGSVGTITMTIPNIEDPVMLKGHEVKLADSVRGSTIGFVSSVEETDIGVVILNCQSRLGRLNSHDIRATPFVGKLRDAFRYYASLAGQTTDVFVDEQIGDRPVAFPGWSGELWYHIKQLAAAQDCEVALVSDIILLRPLRQREAIDHRNLTRSRTYGETTLANAVEIYHYGNRAIENELVYPPGGWTPEVRVLTVGPGETQEWPIELSASVSYIEQPAMHTSIPPEHNSSSVYTIVGDDGLPIQPSQWRANGGSLSVRINDDTSTLTVRITGATNIYSTKGEPISTYSVALGADLTGNRYSTLRIIGTGVAFKRNKIRVRTCLPPGATGTDVGVTIDNPFISDMNDAYRAGIRAARWHSGERMTLSGRVTTVNKLGDSGDATYPTYGFVQNLNEGLTYAEDQAANSGKTYGEVQDTIYMLRRDDFENQSFGNVGGVRIWDRKSNYWFRARTSNIATDEIGFTAEDDLTHADVQERYGALTYREEAALFAGKTYSERDRLGLYYKASAGIPPEGGAYPSIANFPSVNKFPSDVGGGVGNPWPDTFYPDELFPAGA